MKTSCIKIVKISFTKTLNNKEPKREHWGTPEIRVRKLLVELLILTACLLPYKYE